MPLSAFAAIVGAPNLLTDPADLGPYLTEERGLFRGSALAVARPAGTAEVQALVAACAAHGVAIVPQGGRTGLCGGGVPVGDRPALVISTERMRRIRDVDPIDFSLTAEAGCILADVQAAAAEAGCLFPLSLAAEGSARIGGIVSTNAGGVAVLRYGPARDLVLGLEVVLPDGRLWNGLRRLRKDNTGYALGQLFIGAEGTLGIVTCAVLKLFPAIRDRQTALVAVPDPERALALLARARREAGESVSAFELISARAAAMAARHVPGVADPLAAGGAPWRVLIELSASAARGLRPVVEDLLAAAIEAGEAGDAVLAESEEQRARLWRLRESIPEAQKHEGGSIKHDISVAPSRMPELVRRASAAAEAAIPGVRVVAFGHLGDGNLHFNLSQPEGADRAAFLARWGEINRMVHDIVVGLDGSISAEHGIGRLKVGELARTKPAVDLDLMRRIKRAIDPEGRMNPGAILSDT